MSLALLVTLLTLILPINLQGSYCYIYFIDEKKAETKVKEAVITLRR